MVVSYGRSQEGMERSRKEKPSWCSSMKVLLCQPHPPEVQLHIGVDTAPGVASTLVPSAPWKKHVEFPTLGHPPTTQRKGLPGAQPGNAPLQGFGCAIPHGIIPSCGLQHWELLKGLWEPWIPRGP